MHVIGTRAGENIDSQEDDEGPQAEEDAEEGRHQLVLVLPVALVELVCTRALCDHLTRCDILTVFVSYVVSAYGTQAGVSERSGVIELVEMRSGWAVSNTARRY